MANEDSILSYLGTARILQGQWYPTHGQPAHSFAKDRLIKKTMKFQSGQTECTLASHVPTPHQMVTIWNISILKGENTRDSPLFIRCNYIPKAMAAHQEQQDRIFEAFKTVPKGAIEKMDAKSTLKKPVHPLHSGKENAFLNPYWIRTTALLNRQNLMNGIVKIPREICETYPLIQSRIWYPSPYDLEPTADSIYQWCAIPPNHILALYLHPFENWNPDKEGDPHPIPFRIGENVVCWLLCDRELDLMCRQILENWLSIVDLRPLGLLSLDVVGDNPESGTVTLDVAVSYTEWPAVIDGDTIQNLHPIVPDQLKRAVQSE